jgi:hypothetical protein
MSFGTKQPFAVTRPMVLATQTRVNAPTPPQHEAQIERDLIAATRERYFTNAAAFSSTGALQRRPQASDASKFVSIILSALAVGMCVFGVYYWATNGTLEIPGL